MNGLRKYAYAVLGFMIFMGLLQLTTLYVVSNISEQRQRVKVVRVPVRVPLKVGPGPEPVPAPFQPPPTVPPPPPPPRHGTGGGYAGPTLAHHPGYPYPPWHKGWRQIAFCESTLRWHINTGNGFYGGLQFTLSTWHWYGGGRFSYWPHHATRYTQKLIAERVLRGWPARNRPGQGIGAWPVCGRYG